MSHDLYFYLEVLDDGVWSIPAAFAPTEPGGWPQPFASLRRGDRDWLFLDDTSPLRLTTGAPAGSPLCRFIECQWWPRADSDWQSQFAPRWLAVTDLMIDLWDEPAALTMGGRVEARFAAIFGAGDAPLPEAALRAAGMTTTCVIELRQDARPVAAPISTAHLVAASHLNGRATPVTWSASITDILGHEFTEACRRLTRFGAPDRLRLVALRA